MSVREGPRLQCAGRAPLNLWTLGVGRNDVAAGMAAAEELARPADAMVSSIVSTPLGKMAKSLSPTKPSGAALHTPLGDSMPTLLPAQYGAATIAMSPPLVSAPTLKMQALASPEPTTTLLMRVDANSSRIAAAAELLPLPYTHRLQLVAAGATATGGDDRPVAEGAPSGAVGSEALVTDGMDTLTEQVSATEGSPPRAWLKARD